MLRGMCSKLAQTIVLHLTREKASTQWFNASAPLKLLLSRNPLFLSLSRSHFKHLGFYQFISGSGSLRMSDIAIDLTSQNKRKSSAVSASTSPVKNSPSKKLKTTSENMPGVEIEVKTAEVLKDIGNRNKGSPVKAPKVQDGVATKLYFVKMTEKAHEPSKGSKLAAGYDLKSAYKYSVPARGSCLVKTDIQIKLPHGTYGRVAPRSGLALKFKIDVGAGVIDEDYRGNVGVILFNHGDVDFEVNEGDRVAQLICEKIYYPEAVEVKTLDDTERGEGGFGSTGVSSVVNA